LQEVRAVARISLRRVIEALIERAFLAGADWALIRSGVDSAKADRLVKKWWKQGPGPSLRMIQRDAVEDILNALATVALEQKKGVKQERLW